MASFRKYLKPSESDVPHTQRHGKTTGMEGSKVEPDRAEVSRASLQPNFSNITCILLNNYQRPR